METLLKRETRLSLKSACVEFMFAYQQKNVDRMLSFCDPEGVVEFLPLGESGKGKIGEVGRGVWTSIIEAFPNIDNTLDAAVAEENNIVRCQVVIRGKQVKDFAGIKSKGKSFDSDHIFIFHLTPENVIDNIQVSWDHADFTKQLS